MKYVDEYKGKDIAKRLIEKINRISKKKIRIMEVCGTHTVSIFRHGLRSVLPETISLISGPGCPVCVTGQGEIDAFISLTNAADSIVATFGDLIRVPGTLSSLQKEKAEGRDVRIVYSTFDALEIARKNPDKNVYFLGVGFETTAPTIAASIITARKNGIDNYYVCSAHKIVPPALEALMHIPEAGIDGFLLPGHVSVIIGMDAYVPFFEKYRIPGVIGGFEPADILLAILHIVEQVETGNPQLYNAYERVVTEKGNPKALELMQDVFETVDTAWRGIGVIPESGLKLKDEFEAFDALRKLDIDILDVAPPKGCACGDILTGKMLPPACPLYKKSCTPVDPVGPCMVSSEGTCAAYYRYH